MAKSMESSTRQKTFSQLRAPLSVAVVLTFALLMCLTLSAAGQYKIVRVTDGDTIEIINNGKTTTIRLVGIDAPEKFKKKIEAGQPFSQKSTKYLASLVLNSSVVIKRYGNDRHRRTLGVVYADGKNLNSEMVKADFAELHRLSPKKHLIMNRIGRQLRKLGKLVRGCGHRGSVCEVGGVAETARGIIEDL
jgi:endonuclease YncB( thermonuclease family)